MSTLTVAEVAQHLKQEVYRKTIVDVGKGAEDLLGVTLHKLQTALELLKEEGYVTHAVIVEQKKPLSSETGLLEVDKKTIIKVLCGPGITYRAVAEDPTAIQQVTSLKPDEAPTDERISVIFGPTNPNWANNFEHNMLFLHQSERYLNTMLMNRGHVFVNEVFDQLGFDRTVEGQKKGWLYNRGTGADVIDFNLPQNMTALVSNDGSITLTFNVDGEIIEDI